MSFPDAHIHIAQVPHWAAVEGSPVCAASHSPEEACRTDALREAFGEKIVKRSCGIHPQNPDLALLPWLEAQVPALDAIGEAGFDLFTPEYAATLEGQKTAWSIQVDLAVRFQKPLVVHCRKALPLIFADCPRLKRCPAVVFHSFPGSPEEAAAFLRRGVAAYFSLGKPLLNGRKNTLRCAATLPAAVILAETDAPWQTLRGESATANTDIKKVYAALAALRNTCPTELRHQIHANFSRVFGG